MATEIVTSMTVCNAIASTFRRVGGLTVQSYDQLTDGVPQTPLLQIWWQSYEEDVTGTGRSGMDRSASNRKVVQSSDVFVGRLMAKQRSELHRDMTDTMEIVEAMRAVLYEAGPYFGLKAIKAVSHRAVYRDTPYPDQKSYVGARFQWTVRIF